MFWIKTSHLDRAKRIVGYLLFLPDGAIRFRTGEPDFSSLKDQEYDWTRSVYSGACEQIPHDIPKSLGKHVQTAVLHFLNQIPIDAYTKRHHLSSYDRAREAIAENTSHPIGKMAKATLLTSSANIGSLQLCGPCSSLSCSGGARLPPS